MDALAQRITADWMEYREKIPTPHRLRLYLRLDEALVDRLSAELRRCELDGPVELKRRVFSSLFGFLSRLSRTTPSTTEVGDQESVLRTLLFLVGVQFQVAKGQIKAPKEAAPEEAPPPAGEILSEINTRLKSEPDLIRNPLVKGIVLDMQMYKKEYESFKQLSPNISDERAPAFMANFRQRIESITKSAQAKYKEWKKEQEGPTETEKAEAELSLESQALASLLGTQAQELSRVRSTLLFALQESYKFRDPLLRLLEKRDALMGLLDEELRLLKNRDPQNGPMTQIKVLCAYLEALNQKARKGP